MGSAPRYRYIQDQEEDRVAALKAARDAANWMTVEEQAAAERRRLFFNHKVRNSLEIFYQMFPEERPRPREADRSQRPEDEGRVR